MTKNPEVKEPVSDDKLNPIQKTKSKLNSFHFFMGIVGGYIVMKAMVFVAKIIGYSINPPPMSVHQASDFSTIIMFVAMGGSISGYFLVVKAFEKGKWCGFLSTIGISILSFIVCVGSYALVHGSNYQSDTAISSLVPPLFEALDKNDYVAAQEAIRNGADVNMTIAGLPLLSQSVSDNDLNDVEFLIENGADLNKKSRFGRTPLHEAALHGYYDIAELLINSGADVNATNPRGETPLFYAAQGLVFGPKHTAANDRIAELLRAHGAKLKL